MNRGFTRLERVSHDGEAILRRNMDTRKVSARVNTLSRLEAFQSCRRELVSLAYRMLGELARAEDMVQEAWVRWERHAGEVDDAKAFLITIVTRLCLTELKSARARHEESRPDRLPEPVDLEEGGMAVERLEQVSMAFLVLLQRLTPAERAVLLLHDVFDLEHREIAELVGGTEVASRKQLERARRHVAEDRRMLVTSTEEHRRLLGLFVQAATAGDVQALVSYLADDAVMITDGGSGGRSVGGQRNLPKPLQGASRVAAFVAATSQRTPATFVVEARTLNGQPSVVFWDGDRAFAALQLAIADGKIQRVFFHADVSRLGHVGHREDTPAS